MTWKVAQSNDPGVVEERRTAGRKLRKSDVERGRKGVVSGDYQILPHSSSPGSNLVQLNLVIIV